MGDVAFDALPNQTNVDSALFNRIAKAGKVVILVKRDCWITLGKRLSLLENVNHSRHLLKVRNMAGASDRLSGCQQRASICAFG